MKLELVESCVGVIAVPSDFAVFSINIGVDSDEHHTLEAHLWSSSLEF